MSDDPATRVRENITEITSMIVTALWLALLFSGIGSGGLWLAVMLVGYIVVVPLVALLFGDEADKREWWDDWWGDESWDEWWNGESDSSDDAVPEETDRRSVRETTRKPDNLEALDTLRSRYAAGELTDEQFERKLEHLLETETLEDLEQWRGSNGDPRKRTGSDGRDENSDRDRDFEYET